MFRVAFSGILTLLFGLALGYFALANQELVSINLGPLAYGRRPQLYVWEIALFPAIAALVLAGMWSLGGAGSRAGLGRALKEAQTQLRAQHARLDALEAQLRAGGFVPMRGSSAPSYATGTAAVGLSAPDAAEQREEIAADHDATDATVRVSSANG